MAGGLPAQPYPFRLRAPQAGGAQQGAAGEHSGGKGGAGGGDGGDGGECRLVGLLAANGVDPERIGDLPWALALTLAEEFARREVRQAYFGAILHAHAVAAGQGGKEAWGFLEKGLRAVEGGPEDEEQDVALLAKAYGTTPEKIAAAIRAGRKFPRFTRG